MVFTQEEKRCCKVCGTEYDTQEEADSCRCCDEEELSNEEEE